MKKKQIHTFILPLEGESLKWQLPGQQTHQLFFYFSVRHSNDSISACCQVSLENILKINVAYMKTCQNSLLLNKDSPRTEDARGSG